jgi:hypothetical protein
MLRIMHLATMLLLLLRKTSSEVSKVGDSESEKVFQQFKRNSSLLVR